MKKTMQRIISVLICVMLVLSFSATVYASDTCSAELSNNAVSESVKTPYTNLYMENYFDSSITSEEYGEYGISSMVNMYLENKELFSSKSNKSVADLNALNQYLESQNIPTSQSASSILTVSDLSPYEEYLANATDNVKVERLLDLNEGVSYFNLGIAYLAKEQAESFSEEKYPGFADTRDSLRHFSWNYFMTYRINKSTARTIANNHEWGIALYDDIKDAFDTLYDTYIYRDYTQQNAAEEAYAAVADMYPTLKAARFQIIQNSLSEFTAFFDDASIRDLYNNCYGRSYGEVGEDAEEDTVFSMFTLSRGMGELIMSDDSVTYDHRWCVCYWDWYSY